MAIPKIIHQVYLSGDLPPDLVVNVEVHKARNSGWRHELYDERRAGQIILDHYGPTMFAAYQQIDAGYPAARVDLLCNLIIHQFGGVYLDIKSVMEKPLDKVLRQDDTYLLAHWRNAPGCANEGWGLHRDLAHISGGEYIKYFIIAKPGHAYSKAIIEKILGNIENYKPWSAVGRTGVLRTTGPIAYSLGLHSIREQHSHRWVTEDEIGARPSLAGSYDHHAALKKTHYSLMTTPVIRLSPAKTKLSKVFVFLRQMKAFWA